MTEFMVPIDPMRTHPNEDKSSMSLDNNIAGLLVKANMNQEKLRNKTIHDYILQMQQLQEQLKMIAKLKRKIERIKGADGYAEMKGSDDLQQLEGKLAFAIADLVNQARAFLAGSGEDLNEFDDIFAHFEAGEGFQKADLNDLNIALTILTDKAQNVTSQKMLMIQPLLNEMILLSKITAEIIKMQQQMLEHASNKAVR